MLSAEKRRDSNFWWRSPMTLGLAVAVVVVVGYLSLLGWDQKKTLGADGYQHGPYEAWQVIALVALIGALAIWAGVRDQSVVGTVVATIVLTLAFSIDANNNPDDDGLWLVGAVMVLVATALGFWAVSALAHRIHAKG